MLGDGLDLTRCLQWSTIRSALECMAFLEFGICISWGWVLARLGLEKECQWRECVEGVREMVLIVGCRRYLSAFA